MNNYARLDHVKRDVSGVTNDNLDDVYVRAIEAESRAFERWCGGRRFYAVSATRYYGIDLVYGVKADGSSDRTVVYLPDDVVSVSSLKVDSAGDGTYETTLVENTDYRLGPPNGTPKRRLELISTSTQLAAWSQFNRYVEIVGIFGYSYETEATGLTGTVGDTTTTTITANNAADHAVYPGDTIIVENEQCYVSAVTGASITVTRGVNGTTAAAHAAVAISVRRYPRDLEQAIAQRVIHQRWTNNQGNPLGDMGFQGASGGHQFAVYMDVVNSYAAVRF